MKIKRSCGHFENYGQVKDKAALTSTPCLACKLAATPILPEFWHVTPMGLVSSSKVGRGQPDTKREQAIAKGDTIFDSEAEAMAESRRRREAAWAATQAHMATPEYGRAVEAARGFQSLADEANQRVSARPVDTEKAAKLGSWSPDDEDADEALFGGH